MQRALSFAIHSTYNFAPLVLTFAINDTGPPAIEMHLHFSLPFTQCCRR
jgi:hypothetical protein